MFYIDTSNDVYLRADGYGTAGSVFIGTENNTHTLTIKASGNVLIGTATPGAPVHIVSDGTSNTPEIGAPINTSHLPAKFASQKSHATRPYPMASDTHRYTSDGLQTCMQACKTDFRAA